MHDSQLDGACTILLFEIHTLPLHENTASSHVKLKLLTDLLDLPNTDKVFCLQLVYRLKHVVFPFGRRPSESIDIVCKLRLV